MAADLGTILRGWDAWAKRRRELAAERIVVVTNADTGEIFVVRGQGSEFFVVSRAPNDGALPILLFYARVKLDEERRDHEAAEPADPWDGVPS